MIYHQATFFYKRNAMLAFRLHYRCFIKKFELGPFCLQKKSQKYFFFFLFFSFPSSSPHSLTPLILSTFMPRQCFKQQIGKNLNMKYTFVDNLQTILNIWKVDNKYCIFTWVIYFYNLVNMAERVKYVCNNSGVKGITILLTYLFVDKGQPIVKNLCKI